MHSFQVLAFVDHGDTELLHHLSRIRAFASETYHIHYRVWAVGSLADLPSRTAFVNSLRAHAADKFHTYFAPESRGKLLLCAPCFFQDDAEGVLQYGCMPLVAAIVAASENQSIANPCEAYQHVANRVGNHMFPSLINDFGELLGIPATVLATQTNAEETKNGSDNTGEVLGVPGVGVSSSEMREELKQLREMLLLGWTLVA